LFAILNEHIFFDNVITKTIKS